MEITTISISKEDAKAFHEMKLAQQSLLKKQMSDREFFSIVIRTSSHWRDGNDIGKGV